MLCRHTFGLEISHQTLPTPIPHPTKGSTWIE
jgi:hypothetical protein